MTELTLVIALAALLLGFGAAWFLARSHRRLPEQTGLSLLQNQIQELTRTLDAKLGESTRAFHDQFRESAKIIREITEALTKVSEGQKQVLNITDQLRNLQDILKNPKQRGVIGEYYLETVLKNVLPPGSYQMQYPFADGTAVDAVIFYQEKIIPVDSKFSLENYNRLLEAKTDLDRKRYEEALRKDLKERIDETAKYVKPQEGTMEFAFMFIPSEALYYDLLINKVGAVTGRDLLEYAMAEKHVYPVAPTSFIPYLQIVFQGLRQMEISKSTEEIRKNVGQLGRHLSDYDVYIKKVGTHLGTTVNVYNRAYKEFKKIDKDILKITGEGGEVEPLTIEAPAREEEE